VIFAIMDTFKEELEVNENPIHEGQAVEKDDDGSIPARYRGTAADKRHMTILGKKQVLRVCEI
jgi:hypothetical protein